MTGRVRDRDAPAGLARPARARYEFQGAVGNQM